jgi:hypothetical protein
MSVADTFLSTINKDTEGKNTAHKLARFGLWRKTKCNRLAVGLRSASLSPNNYQAASICSSTTDLEFKSRREKYLINSQLVYITFMISVSEQSRGNTSNMFLINICKRKKNQSIVAIDVHCQYSVVQQVV